MSVSSDVGTSYGATAVPGESAAFWSWPTARGFGEAPTRSATSPRSMRPVNSRNALGSAFAPRSAPTMPRTRLNALDTTRATNGRSDIRCPSAMRVP